MARSAAHGGVTRVRFRGATRVLLGLAALSLPSSGCFDRGATDPDEEEILWDLDECDLNLSFLADGGTGLDGIPAISDPAMVSASEHTEIGYLTDDHRVVGLVVAGQPMAIPISALWHHEIVNLSHGGVDVVVTHATLTGASRVHRRSAVSGRDFGVSGLLYKNNLLLYDRSEPPSLWIQLTGQASCGPHSGTALVSHPFVEVTWAGWKTLHPNTLVLSSLSANSALWGQYPYGSYQTYEGFFFDNAMPPLDSRRPAKERVLGIPQGTLGGVAFPFGILQGAGPVAVAQAEVDGEGVVVFWRNDLQGAAAYWAHVGGQALTFFVQDGQVVDQVTGTNWSFMGEGSGGGLDGMHLQAVSEAAVAYWGAWAAFYPNTEIWGTGAGS